jgi:hypothetical protein
MKTPVPNKKIQIEAIGRYISYDKFSELLLLIPSKRRKYALIFKICREMGRRPCEAVAVEITDLCYETRSIRFLIGKTNIVTTQPVPDDLWVELLDYIEKNRHTFVNGFIFPAMTSSSNHVAADTVGRYFRMLADIIGMNQKMPGGGAHSRMNRFYDLVGSCATDITNLSDTTQARFIRRHTDDRAIKHYQYAPQIRQERRYMNLISKGVERFSEPLKKTH